MWFAPRNHHLHVQQNINCLIPHRSFSGMWDNSGRHQLPWNLALWISKDISCIEWTFRIISTSEVTPICMFCELMLPRSKEAHGGPSCAMLLHNKFLGINNSRSLLTKLRKCWSIVGLWGNRGNCNNNREVCGSIKEVVENRVRMKHEF